MRSKFVTPGTSIHYYAIDFDPEYLPWAEFRANILGPTDPKVAPADSLRGIIFSQWKALGLKSEPDTGDNGIHASASPLEGLAERMNWLKITPEDDGFGAALIAAGVSAQTIAAWSLDPQVNGRSLFDLFEDMDSADCLAKAIELSQ
jgi:hypothetical protein